VSGASLPADGRARVRAALTRVLRDPAAWPVEDWTRFRNRLLDECGGDLRALVLLLVRAGELGIPSQLGRTPLGAAAWGALRAPQVMALVGDSFLQPDAAQWAVDAWGVALGVVDERTVAPAVVPSVSAAPPAALATATGGATAGAGTTGWTAAPVRRSAPPPPLVTARPTAAPRAPVAPPPPAVRWLTNLSLGIIALGVVWVIVGSARRAMDPARDRPAAAGATASAPGDGSAAGRAVPGTTAPGTTGDAAAPPGTAADAGAPPGAATGPGMGAGMAGADVASGVPAAGLPAGASVPARPAQRAGVPNALVTRVPPAALQAAQPGVDQLVLRDGRSLIGRVDIIRASDIVFRESATGLRYEFPRRDVSYVITEFGSVVRFEAPVASSPALRARVARGLAGRYNVRFARREVQGSPVCESLWRDTPPDAVVQVRHVAGQDTVLLAFDDGTSYRGIVDDDGLFNTVMAIVPDQAFRSTAVTTRYSGRFLETGFDATVHVIGYRRVRGADVTCYSVLEATAR
jgi:hypothetical protein